MKKVLVTGGTGMIGRYLVPKLLTKDNKVFIASLDGEELCPKGAIFKKLDLRNFDNCMHVCDGKDIVFHLAAQPLVRESYKDPLKTWNTNVIGTLNLLECLKRLNDKLSFKFIISNNDYSKLSKEIMKRDIRSNNPNWFLIDTQA